MLKTTKTQTGVGMVEVLVALVVMGVGMLGVAGLYVSTLQAKGTSLSRMKAVNLAYDIADRIRANPLGGSAYALALGAAAGSATVDCASLTCSPAEMAKYDLEAWSNMVTNTTTGLPGASTSSRSITRTAATSTTPQFFKIDLVWRESTTGSTDLKYSLQVQVP